MFSDLEFKNHYGPWALIIGGSEGIGAAFARSLAQKGIHLLIIAREEPILFQLQEELQKNYSIQVNVKGLDLAQESSRSILQECFNQYEISILVYNATQASVGSFVDHSREEHHQLLRVNIQLAMECSHHLAQRLIHRARPGAIILLSSLAAFQGSAVLAHYSATKAYNLVLAEGLWQELAPQGIDVLAVCPGATQTPGLEKSKAVFPKRPFPPILSPEKVVEVAWKKLGKSPYCVPGFWNRFAHWCLSKLMSRNQRIKIMSRSSRKIYPNNASINRIDAS